MRFLGADAATGEVIFQADDGSIQRAPAGAAVPAMDAFVERSGSNSIPLFTNSIPSPVDFDKFTYPTGNVDIVFQEFFDSALVTSAAANTPNLFISPANTLAYNSNFYGTGGAFPNLERFLCVYIRFELENNDASNPLDVVDVKETFRLGTYSINIGQKSYNDGKLMRFLDPLAPVTLNTKYYSAKPFMSWKLPLALFIGKSQAVKVTTSFTAATLDNTTRLFCYLGGFWYRGVQ
jgi:hypothetical protein